MRAGIGILLVAHAPLASAFVGVAHDMGLPAAKLAALDVQPHVSREHSLAAAELLFEQLHCEQCLVLVDLGGGCSPCIVAQELVRAHGDRARLVAGLNTGMLATALCAATQSQSLDHLATCAVARGTPSCVALLPERVERA